MRDWPSFLVTRPGVGSITPSPDGHRIALLRTRADLLANRTVTSLRVVDAGASASLTDRDADPNAIWFETSGGIHGLSWDPEGERLAFIASGALWVARAPGTAESWLRPSADGSLGQPHWIGHRDELLVLRRSQALSSDADTPLVVRDLPYKQEGIGLFTGPTRLLRVSRSRVVTRPQIPAEAQGPVLALPSPDGSRIAIAAPDPSVGELGPLRVRILDLGDWELEGHPDPAPGPAYLGLPPLVQAMAWSPDGCRLALLAARGTYGGAHPSQLWVGASGQPAELWDGGQDRYLQAVGGADGGLAWVDADTVLAVEAREGSLRLLALHRDTPAEPVTETPGVVGEFALDRVSRRVFGVWQDPSHLAEVRVWPLPHSRKTGATDPDPCPAPGPERILTSGTSAADFPTPEELWISGAKGDRVHGWILMPPASRPPVPCVFLVHGGPYMAHGRTVDLLAQALADAGIAVAYLNPHGSIGYGERFATDIIGDWGGIDRTDWEAFRARLEADGRVDPRRVAIMGASYGGFMASWIAGHWPDLQAAVIQAPVTDQLGMLFASDVGFPFTSHDMGIRGPNLTDEDVLTLWHHSPLAHAANIRARILLLGGDHDHRCPLSQTEALFVALRRLGHPAEMVIYPGETHLLSGSGRPRTREDRARRILAFLSEALLTEAGDR